MRRAHSWPRQGELLTVGVTAGPPRRRRTHQLNAARVFQVLPSSLDSTTASGVAT